MPRSRRSRRGSRRAGWGLPLWLIGLAAAALVAGLLLGGEVIRSLIEATTPPATGGQVTPPPAAGAPPPPAGGGLPVQPVTVTLRAAARTYHTVQIGAFSDQPAAAAAAAAASHRGLAVHVFEPLAGGDRLWRVRSAMAPSRATADRMLAQARAAGYADAFVNTFVASALEVTVRSTDAGYLRGLQEAVEGLAGLAASLDAAWDSYGAGGAAALAGHGPALRRAAEGARAAVAGLVPPADLRERHQVLVGLANLASAAAAETAGVTAGDPASLARAMTEYMAFVANSSRIWAGWR